MKKPYLPSSGGAGPDKQGAKDLSQRVCIQAIAGLCLSDLSQVCEEVLQGETVMERDGGRVLKHQADFSVVASSYRTIWERHKRCE